MGYKIKIGERNANQRIFTINRELPEKGTKKPFLAAHTDALIGASQRLGGVAFKLFIYLLSNQNGYSLAFSPQHFSTNWGVNIDSARRAANELIDANYLVKVDEINYNFYEKPQTKPDELIFKKLVVKVQRKNGEYRVMSMTDLVEYFNGDTVRAKEVWDYAVENNGGSYYE